MEEIIKNEVEETTEEDVEVKEEDNKQDNKQEVGQTIADRLNMMIKELGIRKKDVARRIGITDSSVSTMFSGKSNPSAMTLNIMAKEFGVRTDWLLYGEGDMFGSRQAHDVLNSFFGSVIHSDDEFRMKFLMGLSNFTDSDWATLEKLVSYVTK